EGRETRGRGDGSSQRLDLVLDPDAIEAEFRPAPMYNGRLPQLIDGATGESGRTVIVSQQAARLEELFDEHGVRVGSVESTEAPVVLIHGALGEGWANEA